MPLIVVVETEQRYVERIAEALSPQGWEVIGVAGSEAALEHKADESASLLVVNGEAPDAAKLVDAFARRSGGPGAVVLVPEDADDGVRALGADEVLQKPFTDQQIRLAVRRCLVGLSSSTTAQQEEPVAPPPPKSTERLTSEDLFGEMVSELESVFKFQSPEAEEVEEQQQAPASEEAEAEEEIDLEAVSPPAEEPVEVPAAEEEAPVVELAEEEAEPAPSAEHPESPAAEEPVAEEPVEAESVEAGPAEEEEAVEAAPELEPAGELVAEEAAEEMAAEEAAEEAAEADLREAPPAPPPAPRRDPAAALEERIRQAAEEGKRLAAKGARPRHRGEDLGRSTETLLRQVLEGIDDERPKKRSAERRATEDEVEELVGSVVPKEEPKKGPQEEAQADASDAEEAPFLEVFERDDQQREEDEYQTRLKLIWALILIVVLGLLAFVLVRGMGREPAAGEPAPPAVEEQQPGGQSGGEAQPGELREEGTEGDSEATGEEGEVSEESLEQELEAQRRQLREEIAKSQAAAGEDGP